jgi:O-antigen/teichoic acid export membrane protein
VASNIVETPLPALVASEIPENAVPSTAGMTTKVFKGSLWTLAGQIAPLGVSLFATPFVIRLLGSEGYGVLILVTLIPTYFGFADFGMGMASTKFASEAYAQGHLEKEAKVIRTAALIAFLTSLPFGIGIFVFAKWLLTLFNVPEYLQDEAAFALRIASITFVISFLNGVFNTPQLTRLRMDLNTFVNAGFRILGLMATPVVLYLGGGIVGAVLVLMIANLLTLGGHLYISGILLRPLKGLTIDRQVTSRLTRFGGALAVSGIAAILLINAEKGVLSHLVSVKALAYYAVAFTLASMLTMFSSSMTQSLLPAFSRLQAEDDRTNFNSLFVRGVRMNLVWVAPALVFLTLFAAPFFTIWAGEEFGRESVVPFYILVLGLAFNILAYLPYTAIMASGRTDIFVKLYWIELLPYIVVVWFLTNQFGIIGTATAWSVRVIADAVILFYAAKRTAGVSVPASTLVTFLTPAAIMVLPFVLNIYLGWLNFWVLLSTVTCAGVYSIMVWKTVLEREEILWLLHRLRKV